MTASAFALVAFSGPTPARGGVDATCLLAALLAPLVGTTLDGVAGRFAGRARR
jgi:hypothetical protein